MRIAIVMLGTGAGGLQQTSVPYTEALRRAGHDVLLVLWKGSPLLADARALGLPVETVSWRQLPGPLWRLQVPQLRRILSTFAPDAVIAIAQKGLRHALAARQGRYPVLSHCGGTRPEVIRKLLGADHLIVTSDEMADIAAGAGMPRDHMSVVPNFLLAEAVPHDYTRNGPLRIGSLGRLAERKGYDILVAAVAELKRRGIPAELVIGGTGDEKARLEAQARAAGIDARFPGWIGNDAKSPFLQGIDVFACPSRFEPFGNVYIEAMQHGLPIVTSDTTGARYIFPGGEGAIVVRPDDPVALADGIARLVDDDGLRQELGAFGHQAFATRFSAAAVGPRLSDAVELARDRFHGKPADDES